jgi:hypothetical protein
LKNGMRSDGVNAFTGGYARNVGTAVNLASQYSCRLQNHLLLNGLQAALLTEICLVRLKSRVFVCFLVQ